jgi:phosphoglycolate phosphatase
MTTDRRTYTHIIWDWNGTLLNDAWLCVEIMNGMLTERGLPLLTLDRYRAIFDFPVKDYYVLLGFDFEKEPFSEVGMEFMIRYNQRHDETDLHPEALSVLKTISGMGIPQSVLSAREENELRQEIKKLGIDSYFTRVYGLDDHYAHGKTDVGKKLIRDMGIPPSDLMFIGDTLHDAEVAAELGIRCVLIPNGHQSTERLKKSGLPVFSRLNDILSLL